MKRPLAAVLLLLVTAAPALALRPEAPRIGHQAPRFSANLIDGTRRSLTDYRGRVVLVNFWASWCGPCKAEIPDLRDLQSAYPPEKFTILAINEDDELKAALDFLKKRPVNFPVLLDEKGRIMDDYGVRGLPTTLLIDTRGVVREIVFGPRDWSSKEWKERIDGLLAETARAAAPTTKAAD